jgi:hypothetical protein
MNQLSLVPDIGVRFSFTTTRDTAELHSPLDLTNEQITCQDYSDQNNSDINCLPKKLSEWFPESDKILPTLSKNCPHSYDFGLRISDLMSCSFGGARLI